MTKNFDPILLTLRDGYQVRLETFEGRDHIVAPVVLITEGVHCGSGGCLYYSKEELSRLAQAWNGVPLPVFHPEDRSGAPVSANSPELIQSQSIGRLFNVYFADNRIKGELWVDVQKAREISPEILASIQARKPIEVSTGLFSEHDGLSGIWQGESFDSSVLNIVPDHLALLPGEIGACSVEDGCGVRANKKKGGEDLDKKAELIKATSIKQSYLYFEKLYGNEMSFRDTHMAIQKVVDALDTPTKIHFVEEVFDGFFIMRQEIRNGEQASEIKLFKQEFTVTENDSINLGEEVSEVRRKTEFIELNQNSKEGDKMDDNKKDKGCCPEKVDALIKSENSLFVVEDRDWLLSLNEEQLKKVQPVVVDNDAGSKDEKEDNEEGEGKMDSNKEDNAGEVKANTLEELLENCSNEDLKDTIANGVNMHKALKTELVSNIMKNERNDFTQEELGGKGVEELKKLAKAFKLPTYVGNTVAIDSNSNGEEEPLLAPTHSDNNKGGDK